MRRRDAALFGWLLAVGACASELDVDIETSIGTRARREDPRAQVEDLRAFASTILFRAEPEVAAAAPSGPARPPTSAAELAELTAAIRKGALDELGGPARRIAAAPVSMWPEIREALAAPRRAPKGDYRSMLAAIGGDVPNRYGHFDLAWKKAHGFAVKRSDDWFEDLLVLPRSKISGVLTPVYRDVVLQTSLLRAASEIGKNPNRCGDVVDVLLEVAFLHEGTFRDEVSRAIVAIGDEAVTPLLRATLVGDDPDDAVMQRAEYAAALLDRMDRWIPERAEAALRTEPRRLAELLEVWGQARNGNAAAIMLRHADARVPAVRLAARAAFGRLVDGPPAKTISRRVRLLGGGTGQAQAFLNHQQLAGIAVREALVHVDPAAIEKPCDPPRGGGPVEPRCEGQAARHAASMFAALDARRQAESAAAIATAVAARSAETSLEQLDRLLAERPELGEEPQVAATYRHGAARALERGDARLGAALSRKAAVLLAPRDGPTADTLRVQALLAEASLPELPPLGRQMLLRTAATLRPGDPHVVDALGGGATRAFDPRRVVAADRIAIGCVAVVLAFACVGGITRRRRSA